MLSNIVEYAKRELRRIEDNCHSSVAREIQERIDKQILEVIEVLSNQGHSGMTAPYIMQYVKTLWEWKPLMPLTGEDDEWNYDPTSGNKVHLQNKRCSAVFKNLETGKAYYSDGYVYSEPGSDCWYGCRESKKYIIFPCGSDQLQTEYRKLIFPSKYIPVKWAVKLHLYRRVK